MPIPTFFVKGGLCWAVLYADCYILWLCKAVKVVLL